MTRRPSRGTPPGAALIDMSWLPGRTDPLPAPAGAEALHGWRELAELAERRAAAAAAEAPADRDAAAADPSAILADFRGVAPAVQSFAAGRRR